jgi:hypothetical protein
MCASILLAFALTFAVCKHFGDQTEAWWSAEACGMLQRSAGAWFGTQRQNIEAKQFNVTPLSIDRAT